mgnify:CR=1 FL=1
MMSSGFIKRIINNTPYLAWLDDELNLSIVRDACPHRNYPLSSGHVKNGLLTCAYHGHQYSSSGEIQRIPGLDTCPKFRLKKYNYKIVSDLIFIQLNSDRDFPSFHFLNDYLTTQLEFKINAVPFNIIENTLDPFHVPFVHKPFVTNRLGKMVHLICKKVKNSFETLNINEGKQTGLFSQIFGSEDDIGYERYIHPGILQLEYKRSNTPLMLINTFLIPENEQITRVFLNVQYKPLPFKLGRVLKPFLNLYIKLITIQDIKILETQAENLKDLNLNTFANSEADYALSPLIEIIETNGNATEETFEINFKLP